MRVVFAHDHIFARHDGQYYSPGRLPYSAWQRYLDHFAEVVVLARVHDVPEQPVSMLRADGPRVTFVGLPAERGFRRAIKGTVRGRRLLRETVRSADAVVARVPSEIGISAARHASRAGVVTALEVVASAWHSLWYHGGFLPKLYAPLLEWRTRRIVECSDFALYVTREYLQSKYPCRGTTASASNVAVEIDDSALGTRLTRIDRPEASGIVVGFVGSLQAAHKGLEVALRALVLLVARGINVQLQIVGDGPVAAWQARAELLGVAAQVRFLGALPGSAAVISWLREVDVYVHPSRAEGLPRSLIEAMSCGCLCVGSAVGGIPELLDTSFLHAHSDAQKLAELIERGILDKGLRVQAARTNIGRAASYALPELQCIRSHFFASVAACARKADRHVAAGAVSRG